MAAATTLTMKIACDIPHSVIEEAIAAGVDIARLARESICVELYRRGIIDRTAVTETLGLTTQDAEALLEKQEGSRKGSAGTVERDPRSGLVEYLKGELVFVGTRVPVETLWFYLAREEANDGGVKSFMRDFDVPFDRLAAVIHAAGDLFAKDPIPTGEKGASGESDVRRELPMGIQEGPGTRRP